MHKLNIIHRDMKPENVLMNQKMEPLIGDFGLSKYVKQDVQQSIYGGTLNYMAPEIFDECEYDERVDVYAFGMIVYAVITLNIPWNDMRERDIKENVTFGIRPPMPSSVSKSWSDLIQKCWDHNPNQRPSMSSIVWELGSKLFVTEKIDIQRFKQYQLRVVPKDLIYH